MSTACCTGSSWSGCSIMLINVRSVLAGGGVVDLEATDRCIKFLHQLAHLEGFNAPKRIAPPPLKVIDRTSPG